MNEGEVENDGDDEGHKSPNNADESLEPNLPPSNIIILSYKILYHPLP